MEETRLAVHEREPLRNPVVASALTMALTKGDEKPLFASLCRLSGLPGPKPNDGLAGAVGRAISSEGRAADVLIAKLCAMDARRAPAGTVLEYLPMVGAFCLVARLAARQSEAHALAGLRALSEDARHAVRDAVIRALAELRDPDHFARSVELWTDAYLPAAVAIAALTQRSMLDRIKSPGALIARLDEAFSLAERAPRADQRSQGFRLLIKTIGPAASAALFRFPGETIPWLESRSSTDDVELRAVLSDLLHRMRQKGVGSDDMSGIERGFEAATKPRRDPKTYVGPTRRRGARGKGRT